MTSTHPQAPGVAPEPRDPDPPSRPAGGGDGPVNTLRGAGVEVDGRRVGRVLAGLCLAGLAVLAVALFIAGAHKNAQITELRRDGVPVKVTVTRCLGLLGGSGSNTAGYSCKGAYSLGGHRYEVAIPGYTLYGPGTTLSGVAVPSDPTLFSLPGVVRGEHSSSKVYVVPVLLLLTLAIFLTALGLVRARSPERRRQPARSSFSG